MEDIRDMLEIDSGVGMVVNAIHVELSKRTGPYGSARLTRINIGLGPKILSLNFNRFFSPALKSPVPVRASPNGSARLARAPLDPNPVTELDKMENELRLQYRTICIEFHVRDISSELNEPFWRFGFILDMRCSIVFAQCFPFMTVLFIVNSIVKYPFIQVKNVKQTQFKCTLDMTGAEPNLQ
ncbi:transmembrane protein, putative [Medicago truncatula]|uniref:Transmembrane protein, putative n=1 Tax=Medicago truncatula TaxID=3880 RepID=G7LJN7_MEDTR|nr:transmembrane protein, putative [Medicago truncatula]